MSEKSLNKETVERFLGQIKKGALDAEEVPIASVIGRVLFEDVAAVMDDPPYSKATVEGYLFLVSGTALSSPKRPMTFNVLGDIPDPSMSIELPSGKAVRVKKDSYMAIKRFIEGHYAVLKTSEVKGSEEVIHVTHLVEKHTNIILQGSIRKIGNIIFKKGYTLQARDIVTLAHQGIPKVKVSRLIRVAIFSTGMELIAPGTPYRIGYNYDCNAYTLSAMVERSGGQPLFQGIMPNDLLPFIKTLAEVVKTVDMVVLSGATVALGGNFTSDLIKGASSYQITNPAAILEAHRRAMVETGIRPTFLGIVATKPVICLAGEKEHIVEGFEEFVAPTMAYLLGKQNNL